MSNTNRYREIEVAGSPRELGEQIGEAARAEIRGFCEIAMRHVQKTKPVSRATAVDVARRSAAIAEAYSPDMMDELRGMASAAGVGIDELMVLQVRNQLQPDAETACTALSLAAGTTCGAIVAQNWDSDPELDEFTVVLTRRPAGKPALTTCTQAGLISYLGFNAAGIGACVNSLPAPSRGVGVPHYFTLRGIYEATSLEGAVRAVRRADRAIPANILLSTPQGPADLEVTIDDVYVLRPEADDWISHTNHCVHPTLKPINDDFAELIQSHARKRRVDQLLAGTAGDLNRTVVKTILSDHEDAPRSICRHANDDPVHGFWETVFSVIIEPGERCMHISRGTPCNNPYEKYSMD